MPKKELTDFQLELLQKNRNKARVKQERDLRKRIFALGVESNKERQLRISVANANKVIAAEIARKRGIVSEDESDDDELDSNSSNEVETVTSNDSDANTDPHTSPINERDQQESIIRQRDLSHALYFVLGLVIGLVIDLLQQPSPQRW
jgi:translation initiation factor 2B subunit (eIF-2B alpha/beta/delta family)